MSTQQTIDISSVPPRELIAEEAAEWLVTLRATTFGEDDPNGNAATRNAAFVDWVRRSRTHLMLFMEMWEVERRFKRLDEPALARIRDVVQVQRPVKDSSS